MSDSVQEGNITRAEIGKLFINNRDFEKLSSELSGFNPFKVLNVQDYEIRHSNVLAWLFDPAESHNLRDEFFKRFMLTVYQSSDNENRIDELVQNDNTFIRPEIFSIYESNYLDLEVFRELDNIDLLLVSENNKLVVCIENKINSKQHSGQLKKYFKNVIEKYDTYEKRFVFLTVMDEEPKDPNFFTANYDMVVKVLESLLNLKKEMLPNEVYQFIKDYKEIIMEKTTTNEELENIARKLYKDHSSVIDFLYQVGNNKDLTSAFVEFIKETSLDPSLIHSEKANMVWFRTPEIKYIPKMNNGKWGDGYPIMNWFLIQDDNIRYVIELGPFTSNDKRYEFLNFLKDGGLEIKSSSLKRDGTYTRMYSEKSKKEIKDWSDTDQICKTMESLFNYKKAEKFRKDLGKLVSEYDWSTDDD